MAALFPSIPSSFPTPFPFSFPAGDSSNFITSTTMTNTPATTASQTTPPPGLQTWYTSTSIATSTDYYPRPTNDPDEYDHDDDGFFDELENGTKAGMGVAIAIGALIIVGVSVWYCCGCCGLRARRSKRREAMRASDRNTERAVPLDTMGSNTAPPPPGRDAPPQYEEAVPPRHQHIAGGARYIRDDEEEGVISDGKTPLSEIPFEDVVLDHSPSEGSSRSFIDRHHGSGGDTRGHTNT